MVIDHDRYKWIMNKAAEIITQHGGNYVLHGTASQGFGSGHSMIQFESPVDATKFLQSKEFSILRDINVDIAKFTFKTSVKVIECFFFF